MFVLAVNHIMVEIFLLKFEDCFEEESEGSIVGLYMFELNPSGICVDEIEKINA